MILYALAYNGELLVSCMLWLLYLAQCGCSVGNGLMVCSSSEFDCHTIPNHELVFHFDLGSTLD